MQLVPAEAQHAYAMEELEAELFEENSFNATMLRNELRQGYGYVVVKTTGEVVGYAVVRYNDGVTDILRLGVTRLHQGAGIGRWLLQTIVVNALAPVMLTVHKDNSRALALYKSFDFRIVGDLNGTSWVMLRESSAV